MIFVEGDDFHLTSRWKWGGKREEEDEEEVFLSVTFTMFLHFLRRGNRQLQQISRKRDNRERKKSDNSEEEEERCWAVERHSSNQSQSNSVQQKKEEWILNFDLFVCSKIEVTLMKSRCSVWWDLYIRSTEELQKGASWEELQRGA